MKIIFIFYKAFIQMNLLPKTVCQAMIWKMWTAFLKKEVSKIYKIIYWDFKIIKANLHSMVATCMLLVVYMTQMSSKSLCVNIDR